MKIIETVTCFNVDDVTRAGAFFVTHFGFEELFAADGFASLTHREAGVHIALHRRGLGIMPEKFRDQPTSGTILAFRVADAAAAEVRLRAEGVEFLLPLTEQTWGERALLVAGPDGIVVEVCDFPER